MDGLIRAFCDRLQRAGRSIPSGTGSAIATAACVEPLPERVLLSVDPAMAQRLLDAGFERITWKGDTTYAEPGQWIASIRNVHGDREGQLAAAAAKLNKAAPRAGLHVARQLGHDGVFRVDAPAGMKFKDVRAALGRVKGLAFAEPNFAVWAQDTIPDDPDFATQYGLNNTGQGGGLVGADIDATAAWDLSTGSDVVVGVIDTGVDYNHPDLAPNMWVNPFEIAGNGVDDDGNGFVDDVHGADFADLDGDPMDDHNHGTHVAGLIAAANNGQGTVGVAYHAKIMALRFLSADGFGGVDFAVQALNYAMDMKSRGVNIRLTNNSWGGADFSQAMDDAIRRSADAGMLFVAAAGNGGDDRVGDDVDVAGNEFYPASHEAPSIISVAATDSRDLLAGFSNFGAAGVDLAAAGVGVYSTIRNGAYTYFSGTSMATPLVSGVAALAFSMKPDATWQQVRDAILGGVDKLPTLAGKTVTGGRLNALSTLRRLLPPAVVGRHVFYNNSSFDGRAPTADARDDNAVAPDKVALLPGDTATFANYTSYSRGVNGVMIDVRNLPEGGLDAEDFAFNLGTDSDLLANWEPAPTPGEINVRRGAGDGGSDRVTITFPDGSIRNTWLRVTLKATADTGLARDDVFYFGNATAETGNSPDDALVNAIDLAAVRTHQSFAPQPIASPFDLDRDGRVTALDLSLIRRSRGEPVLPLITLPDV